MYIVAFDTDKIKDYVFATNKLKEIRGASAILDELNEETFIKQLLPDGDTDIVFIGGGSGMIIFKNKDEKKAKNEAEEFCKKLEEKYLTFSEGGASVTTATIEVNDLTNFQTLFQRLQLKLRQNKDAKYQFSQLLTHPYFRYCDSDGNLYAEKINKKVDIPDEYFISMQVRKKRSFAKESRVLFKKFIKFLLDRKNQNFSNWKDFESNLKNIFDNFKNVIAKKDGYKGIPNPLPDEITNLEDDRGYIGLIYADANRMGERLEKIENKNAYGYFSEEVKKCNEEAIFTAIAKTVPPKTGNGNLIKLLPFEIFLLGGDDIILAVPGIYALEVARIYLDNFKELTKNKLNNYTNGDDFNKTDFRNGISISAGVVFAHGNYPLHLLLKYATELQKNAKKKSRELETQNVKSNEKEVNCIDFEIVKETLLSDIKSKREPFTDFKDPFTGKILNLYKRPYSTKEITDLINEIKIWQNISFPKNKLSEMYELLHQGQMQAQIGFLRILRRLPENIQIHLIQKYVMNNEFPWKKDKNTGHYTTSFFDIIEIYDFVSEKS